MEKSIKMWMARNKNGGLFLYPQKPTKAQVWEEGRWVERPWFTGVQFIRLDSKSFKDITYENSPQKISITITQL